MVIAFFNNIKKLMCLFFINWISKFDCLIFIILNYWENNEKLKALSSFIKILITIKYFMRWSIYLLIVNDWTLKFELL